MADFDRGILLGGGLGIALNVILYFTYRLDLRRVRHYAREAFLRGRTFQLKRDWKHFSDDLEMRRHMSQVTAMRNDNWL